MNVGHCLDETIVPKEQFVRWVSIERSTSVHNDRGLIDRGTWVR